MSYITITQDDILRILTDHNEISVEDVVSYFLFRKFGSRIAGHYSATTLTELVSFHNKLFFVASDVMLELWEKNKVEMTEKRKWKVK